MIEKINELLEEKFINKKIFFQNAIYYEKYNLCKFLIKNISFIGINEMFQINIYDMFSNKKPIFEWTCPLIYFIKKQNIKIIELLIDEGANVNIRTHMDDTPLKIAIEKRNIEIPCIRPHSEGFLTPLLPFGTYLVLPAHQEQDETSSLIRDVR